MKYYLKCYDYVLSDVDITLDKHGRYILINFEISKDPVKVFEDFEIAEDIRKLIYIETGLNLVVKKFKKGEE